jgi:hypothetical protein
LYGGEGDDTLRVLDTLSGVGVLGNGAFTIAGGAGNDAIDLHGLQYNLRGSDINMVDGGAGFDTLRWNARYDLNPNSNQTGADAAGLRYAAEIGVRDVERLDLGSATGRNITLAAADVAAITAGSDFDRSTLTGLNLSGAGHTLFVELGATGNVLTLQGGWTYLGNTSHDGTDFAAYQQGDSILLVHGGSLGFNAGGAQKTAALDFADVLGTPPTDSGASALSSGQVEGGALMDNLSLTANLSTNLSLPLPSPAWAYWLDPLV